MERLRNVFKYHCVVLTSLGETMSYQELWKVYCQQRDSASMQALTLAAEHRIRGFARSLIPRLPRSASIDDLLQDGFVAFQEVLCAYQGTSMGRFWYQALAAMRVAMVEGSHQRWLPGQCDGDGFSINDVVESSRVHPVRTLYYKSRS